VLALHNLGSLFSLYEFCCPYVVHEAIERALALEPCWINPILSIILQLDLVPMILEKTAVMLIENKYVEIELNILSKVCNLLIGLFSSETYIQWIEGGVNVKILAFVIAFTEINERVLEAALSHNSPNMLISLLDHQLRKPSMPFVATARSQDNPGDIFI
jgi:hypothetical protein